EFGTPQTLLYDQRSGDIFPVKAGFEHLTQSSVKWADFDTDGDMDVFISGKTGTISKTLLYENNTGSLVNVRPSSPSNLQVTDYGFGKIKLSWDKASDDYTSKSSLSYVIALGNESGQSTQFTTESNLETGYRLNPKPSSTLQNFMYLELDPGNYFFSVQAVDANYAGSEFSEEVAFGVTYIWKELNLGGIVDNSLPAGEDASVKFSDFDGDGDFDLAIFGKNLNHQFDLGLLENKGGSFEKIYDFEPITKGDFDWADINGDGTLDLFMTGENPWDETQVRANLYLNRTPIVDAGDSTFDGQFRWMDGRIFEEELITWQFQEPNDDQSFTAYGYLNGSYPPQIYDIGGDHTWYQGSALVESPVDYSVPNNGSWTWRNGQRIQDYVAWGDQYQPAVDPWASGAYAVVFSNGIFAEQAENGAQHPVILEIDEDASIATDVLNRISLIGNHDGIDYYGSNDYYSAPDIFENFNSYYSGFTMLTINTADEWNWVSENFGSMYGWIGLSVKYPIITNDNFTVYYQGNVGDKNYYRFDFYNGPQSALAIIDISFPGGSTLFIPDDQAELDVVLNRFGNHGLIGVVRKGFPSGTQRSLTNFQNSNLYFEPLVNAKVKFADIDNNGTPELIYAGSTSSTSIGRPALKIYKFLEDGFNITQREVQLSQELPNLTESSIEFGDLDRDQDIDIVLSGFDPFSGRRTIIFKNDGLDKSGRLILTEDFSSSPVGVQNGTIDLIDFDNDGDLDMVISGDSREGDVLQIYENQEGSFLELPASLGGLEAMKNGRTSWGDFNGDGFADILYSGEVVGKGDFTGLAIYDQSSAAFLQDNFDLSQFANAAVAFGDYDADDDLDMVLTGENKYFDEFDPGSQKYISKLYVNVRNESAKLNPGAPTNQAQGDYSAMTTSNLFTSQVNQPPSIPVLSEVETLVDSTSSGLSFVQLNWSPSVDDFTASAGLTYSLRIGSSPGSNDILDAQANADGSRRVSGKGNVEHNTSWKISLPTGSYYWSVQALDASYSASSFSEEETFLVTESGSVDINVAPNAVDTAFTLRIEEEVGYNVGAVNVSDANGDELLFSILSGNEAGVFSIGQTTGVIFLADKTNLDTALTTQFILDILISDGALSDTAVVTIDILAENNAPVANSLDFEITADAAHGTVVGQVEATDPDGDAVSYSIVSGNEQGIFEVAESSGEITIVKPDLLEARTYVLGVEVSDGLAATTIDITIEVRSLLGIEDMLANVAVYPIPTSERLTVQLYQLRNVEITLLDLSGREIMLRQVEAGDTELDVSQLRKGIYLLKLSLMEQDLEYVRKIVIE
ncbi:MAG: FG-GAP-like repeat-containing protein, partial [Cyclobacteriaceae bacterium]